MFKIINQTQTSENQTNKQHDRFRTNNVHTAIVAPRSDPRIELAHMAAHTKTDSRRAGNSLRDFEGASCRHK